MSRALQICATLVVASGLPHGLVAPSRLRTAAHDAVHDAVVRHVGRKALDARHACAARARLLRDLVRDDLEAAVDLSLSLGAEFRASLPEGCVLEDRPHAGFATVVTKVQRERNGTRGERISHVQLAAGEPFSKVEAVGARAFSGSATQVPVVGFELNGTFYLADAAIRCDRAALCTGGDGTPVQLASLDEAALVSDSFTARRLHTPLQANARLPWVAVAEDAVTDYVTGTKSLLLVPICYYDEGCDAGWGGLSLVAGDHGGDAHAYLEQVAATFGAYAASSSGGRVEFKATVSEMVTLSTVSRAQCGEIGSINYWQGGSGAYDTLAYEVLNALGTYGAVPGSWDFVAIMIPNCWNLYWGGIGWVSHPGTAQNVGGWNYDASLAHELGHNFGANHASVMHAAADAVADAAADAAADAEPDAAADAAADAEPEHEPEHEPDGAPEAANDAAAEPEPDASIRVVVADARRRRGVLQRQRQLVPEEEQVRLRLAERTHGQVQEEGRGRRARSRRVPRGVRRVPV